MFENLTSVVWHAVLPSLVVVVCLIRLLVFVRRRRDRVYQGWVPAEIVAVRSVVMIVTGKPVTTAVWRRIDALLLVILILAVTAGVFDMRQKSDAPKLSPRSGPSPAHRSGANR